jgi:hypothetical protein
MDPFAIVLFAALLALVIWVVLLGRCTPGSGLEQLGLKTGREITEQREALEAEDLEQMMAARNARRRARGEKEISAEDYEMQVMADISAQRRRDQEEAAARRDRELADRELDELLEATNARRRARGLPERTREDVRREFGQ